MKIITLLIVMLLMSCSTLTEREKSIAGEWTWNMQRGKFSEVGFLNLNKNGKYTYSHESKNPTEVLSEIYEHEVFRWHLEGDRICLHKSEGEKVDCDRFSVISNGKTELVQFNFGFIVNGVHAIKSN